MIMVSCYVTLRNRESFKISECPASGDPFKHKKFVRDCYAHESSSCKAVLEQLKIDPYSMGLSQEDTDTSLGMISNNLYVSVDANDPTKYSLNECVIPEALRTDLDLQQCTIDDVQLRSSNPEDPGIAWTYKNGCIISEDQIRQHFPKILKYVNDKRKEIKEGIKTSLSDGINENTSATSVHNSNTKTNNDDTSIKKGLASDARLVKATSISTTQSLANMQTWYTTNEPKVKTSADNETVSYNNMKKDCKLGYNDWSACDAKGQQTREQVILQSPENGGITCPSSLSKETRSCIPTEIYVPLNENLGSIRSAEDLTKCVDLDGRDGKDWHASGATVLNYPCRNPPTGGQLLWRGNGSSLAFNGSRKCLDVAGWGTHRAEMIQWACHHGGNQQWYYYDDQSLRPGHDKRLCLTRHGEGMRAVICGRGYDDDPSLITQPLRARGNQQWVFR
jgi:hypothetical protein